METVARTRSEIDVQALLDEVLHLRDVSREVARLRERNEQQALEIQRLMEFIKLLQAGSFGRKADKVEYDENQLKLPGLFNEAEATSLPEADEVEVVPEHTRRKRGGRKPLPESLPREERVIDLSEEDKVCDCCGKQMVKIGEDCTERLQYQPAVATVIVEKRPKYGCRQCECAPKQAKPAPQLIPKSIATPSLLAFVLIGKFIDAIPLYRQEKQWARLGVDLSRAVLSSWVVRCGTLLTVLWELMQQEMRGCDLVQADETPVQVIKEQGRSAAQKSYMWHFQCGPPGKRILLYHYAPSRAGSVASEFLGEQFRGYLQSDGYAGYHALCGRDGVHGVACMSHIRRKFADAAKIHANKPGLAHKAVAMINRLYGIERRAREQGLSPEQLHALRQKKARPIMDCIKQWMDEHQSAVPPKSPLGKAFTYAQSEWVRMERYLEDGRIKIDNNAAERGIKPFVIGRKNWLFCNTANGAHASAVIYSLLQSADANALPLLPWLTFVLDQLPRCTTDDERRSLLPHRFDVQRLKGE